MLSLIKKLIVLNFGYHFAHIYDAEDKEINLFVKSLRGVSGVDSINWKKDLGIKIVFVLGNTNKVEIAMRELISRFSLSISRVQTKNYS